MTVSPASARAVVVYNPVKIDARRLRQAATARAARHGWSELDFYETTQADPGEGLTRDAVAGGAGLVLSVGGDGATRSVATGLAGTGIPLGIVPRGTGNLLARNLGLPLDDLDAALAVAMGGRTRVVDLGLVEYTDGEGEGHDEFFLVMLGAGMDADMIAGTDDRLKARVGWVAYVGAFVRTVLHGHRIRVEYAVEGGEPVYSHTRSLLVANCGMLQGGMVLLPDAEVDDGLLDVLALRPKGVTGWVRTAWVVLVEHTFLRRLGGGRRRGPRPAAVTREGRPARPLDLLQGTEMTATVLESPAAFQIDGEDIGTVTGFSARIKRRGLSVRVPH